MEERVVARHALTLTDDELRARRFGMSGEGDGAIWRGFFAAT